MSCIITHKGRKYSEEQFKEYFINNKNEFATSIAKNKYVIDSFKRKMEGIDFVFSQSPELASIGSKAQYLQYLSTIFKTSKVKDIVYHYSPNKFDKFDKSFIGTQSLSSQDVDQGFSFVDNKLIARAYGSFNTEIYTLPKEVWSTLNESVYNVYDENIISALINPVKGDWKNSQDGWNEIMIKDVDNIHILGSKQDIEGFKNFIENLENNDLGKQAIRNVYQKTFETNSPTISKEEVTTQTIQNPKATNLGHIQVNYGVKETNTDKQNVSNILDNIKKNSTNKAYKVLAGILLQIAEKQNSFDGIKLVFENSNLYNPKTQELILDVSEKNAEKFEKTFQYNFLHELVHHLTISKMTDGSEISKALTRNIQNLINVLEKPENLQKAIDLLNLKTTPEQLLNKLDNLRNEQNSTESLTTFFSEEERSILNPLINPFEFASSILNDENTQKWMNGINYEESKFSVTGKFIDYIKGLFNNLIRTLGLSGNKTVLNEGLNNVLQILTKEPSTTTQLGLFASLRNIAKLTPTEPILNANTQIKKEAITRQEQRKNVLWNQYNKIQLDKSLTREEKQTKIDYIIKRIKSIEISINKLRNDFSAAVLEEELLKAVNFAKEKLNNPNPSVDEIVDAIAVVSSAKSLINLAKSSKLINDVSPEILQSLENISGNADNLLTDLVSLSKEDILASYKDITGRNDITEEEFFNQNVEKKLKIGLLGGEDNVNPMSQYVSTLTYDMQIKSEQEIIERKLENEKKLNEFTEKYDFKDLLEERLETDPLTGVKKYIKNFKTRSTAKYWEAIQELFNKARLISDGKNKAAFIKSEQNKIQFVLDLRFLFPEEFNKDMGESKLSSSDKEKYFQSLKEFFIQEYSEYPEEYAVFRMNEVISQAEKRFKPYLEERDYIFERIKEEFPEDLARQTLAENNWLAYNSPFLLLNERYSLSTDNMKVKNQTPYSKLPVKVTEDGVTTFVKWSKIDELTGETVKLRVADKYISNKPRRKFLEGNITGFISDEYTQWEVEFFEKAFPEIQKGNEPPVTMLGFLNYIQELQKEYLSLLPRYLNQDVEYFSMLDVPADFKELIQEASVFNKFTLYGQLLWDGVVKDFTVPYLEKQQERIDLITNQIEKEFNPKFQHDSFNQRGLGDLKTNDVYKYFDFIRNATISYKYKSEYEIKFKQAQFLYNQGALTNASKEVFNADKELFDWIIDNKVYNEKRDSRKQKQKGIVTKKILTKFEKDKVERFKQQLEDIEKNYPFIEDAPNEVLAEYNKIQSSIDKIQRQVTFSTVYDSFESFLRFKFLSWSPMGRVWDTVASGYIGGMSEAMDGKHFKENDFAKGLTVINSSYGAEYLGYLGTTTAIFGGIGAAIVGDPISIVKTSATIGAIGLGIDKLTENTNLKKKVSQLLLRTGALEKADYLSKEDQRDILEGILQILRPYTLLEKADIYNKGCVLLPLFFSTKIKDKNDDNRPLWDAFIINENGELSWNNEEFNSQESYNLQFTGNNSSEWLKFRKKVDRVIKNTNGDSSSNLTTNLGKKSTAKRALLFLKSYMPQAFNRTWTQKTYDPLTNTYYTGKLAGLYLTLSKSARGVTPSKEEQEAYNAAMFQLSLWISLSVAAMIIKKATQEEDGDDDSWLWSLYNIVNRTQADTGNTFDATSTKWERTTSFIPQLKYIFDSIAFLQAVQKALFGNNSVEINDQMTRQEMVANKLIPKNQVIDVDYREETNEETGETTIVPYFKMYDPTIDKETNFLKNPSKYNKLYNPQSRTLIKGVKLAPLNAYKQIDNLRKTNNIWK